jgi:hypothetical protein
MSGEGEAPIPKGAQTMSRFGSEVYVNRARIEVVEERVTKAERRLTFLERVDRGYNVMVVGLLMLILVVLTGCAFELRQGVTVLRTGRLTSAGQ